MPLRTESVMKSCLFAGPGHDSLPCAGCCIRAGDPTARDSCEVALAGCGNRRTDATAMV